MTALGAGRCPAGDAAMLQLQLPLRLVSGVSAPWAGRQCGCHVPKHREQDGASSARPFPHRPAVPLHALAGSIRLAHAPLAPWGGRLSLDGCAHRQGGSAAGTAWPWASPGGGGRGIRAGRTHPALARRGPPGTIPHPQPKPSALPLPSAAMAAPVPQEPCHEAGTQGQPHLAFLHGCRDLPGDLCTADASWELLSVVDDVQQALQAPRLRAPVNRCRDGVALGASPEPRGRSSAAPRAQHRGREACGPYWSPASRSCVVPHHRGLGIIQHPPPWAWAGQRRGHAKGLGTLAPALPRPSPD